MQDIQVPQSHRNWRQFNSNAFPLRKLTDTEKQTIQDQIEAEYYSVIYPYYKTSLLSQLPDSERQMLDLLIVLTQDTRFGEPRLDGTRLTVWDILNFWDRKDTDMKKIFDDRYAILRIPLLTFKNVRNAVAIWFIERWMAGPLYP